MVLTVISNRSCFNESLETTVPRQKSNLLVQLALGLFALTQQGVIDCFSRRIGSLDSIRRYWKFGAPLAEHHRLEGAGLVIIKLFSGLACILFKFLSIVVPFSEFLPSQFFLHASARQNYNAAYLERKY